jgi:hypothetical protein
MDKLSIKKQISVIRYFLAGLSYREIGAKVGVSTGTVAAIVAQLKEGQYPEVEEPPEQVDVLRELAVELHRLKIAPSQSLTGAMVLSLLKDLNIEPSQIRAWGSISKQLAKDKNPQEIIHAALYLDDLHRTTGLTPQALEQKVEGLRVEASRLEPLGKEVKAKQQLLGDLDKKLKAKGIEEAELQKRLEPLRKDIEQKEKSDAELSLRAVTFEERALAAEQRLSIANKSLKTIAGLDFSPDQFAGFVQRMNGVANRHNIKPAALRDRLMYDLEQLDIGMSMESEVKIKRKELSKIEQTIKNKLEERTALEEIVVQLRQQRVAIQTEIANEQSTIRNQMQATARAAEVALSTFRNDLQQCVVSSSLDMQKIANTMQYAMREALQSVLTVRDHSIEAGIEIGRLESTIESQEWPSSVLALVKGDDNVKPYNVRTVLSGILTGAKIWIQKNPHNIPNIDSSPLTVMIDKTIGELDRWQV